MNSKDTMASALVTAELVANTPDGDSLTTTNKGGKE